MRHSQGQANPGSMVLDDVPGRWERIFGCSMVIRSRGFHRIFPWKMMNYQGPWMATLQYIYQKTMGKPEENGGLMIFCGIYPLVMTNVAMENDH